ncbi:MAG: hypothetical protein LC799_10250 [Actinobacteria bacterium]|nr:hypothetical protein [Actinomycetota bacterium]
MATPQQVTSEVQEQILDTVRVGQKAVLDFVRSWAQTVETTFSRFPELTFAQQGYKPTEALESAFGFTEKVLASQREFANKLYEASIPATRATPAAARAASKS